MKVKTSRVKTFQISYTSDDVMTRLKSLDLKQGIIC